MNMKKLLFALAVLASGILTAQTDINDARTNYSLGESVTVTGIVTNDGSLGSVRYIQDATGGVALYPGFDWSGWDEPTIGDEVTVTGVLTEFNGLLEVGPDLTAVTINSSGNPSPTPLTITPDEMEEDLEGVLVEVESALFDQGGTVISGNNTYSFNASGEEGVIYIRNGNYLVDAILPAGETNIVGIISQFDPDNSGDGYQILPRDAQDFVPLSAINIASEVEQTNITQTSFTLNWLTDTNGDSQVEYGLTPALGSVEFSATATNDHSIDLSGLEPGTVYYARVTSTAGEDDTVSPILAFATESESSGDILAYFNHDVDHTVATGELAINIGADMKDTIAAYITRAQHTLDIAAYNINNSLIVDAINTAQENGVQIRYIAHSGTANFGIGNFNGGIPVHYRPDDNGSGMHNKFLVMDAEYTDLAFVLTGSTNLTTDNLVSDPNNLIIFQDESIAKGFTLEFNEMWGSDTDEPDPANAKFGADKEQNTPKKYIIGGSAVEVHFSPSDGTTRAIQEAIESTEYDLYFATLAFTRNDLGNAVEEFAGNIFIEVQGIIEQINTTGSEYQDFVDAGMDVFSHQETDGQMHHKMAIIDQSEPQADPIVITGSHNWSTSAETINDENTVFVHDATIANIYYQAFRGMLLDMGVGIEEQTDGSSLYVYPNPTEGMLFIQKESGFFTNAVFTLTDLSGRTVWTENLSGTTLQVSLDHLPAGYYVLNTEENGVMSSIKVIVK